MELVPLGPGFGVEIRGITLADVAASDKAYQSVRAAFEEHSLLLFRHQEITDDVQAAFSRAFGPLERVKVGSEGAGSFYSRLHNIAADGSLVPETHRQALTARANQLWHPELMTASEREALPPVRWRMTWRNPLNGRIALYIASHAYAVEGLGDAAARALLDELIAVATRPEFIYPEAVYSLRRWPDFAVLKHRLEHQRIATLLGNRAAVIPDIVRLAQVDEHVVNEFLNAASLTGRLVAASAPQIAPSQPWPNVGSALLQRLRKALGIGPGR